MIGLAVDHDHAVRIVAGLMPTITSDTPIGEGEALAISDGKAVLGLVRVKNIRLKLTGPLLVMQVTPFYVFSEPIACDKTGLFVWAIPDDWMKKAAEEAGMPEMFDLWKAVQNGESK